MLLEQNWSLPPHHLPRSIKQEVQLGVIVERKGLQNKPLCKLEQAAASVIAQSMLTH